MLPYVIGWFGLCALAIANGALREKTYGRKMSEQTAHQGSTLIAAIVTAIAAYTMSRAFPIQSNKMAWSIGITWLLITISFEALFGHFVAGYSWNRLLADYNLLKGRVWGLFLVWLLILPYLLYRAQQRAI